MLIKCTLILQKLVTHNQQSQPNLLIVTDNSHQSNMQHGETSTSQHNYNASQATRIRTTAIKTEPYIHQLDGQISIGAGHSERKDIRKKPERSAGMFVSKCQHLELSYVFYHTYFNLRR